MYQRRERRNAYLAVHKALRTGDLKRANHCSSVGTKGIPSLIIGHTSLNITSMYSGFVSDVIPANTVNPEVQKRRKDIRLNLKVSPKKVENSVPRFGTDRRTVDNSYASEPLSPLRKHMPPTCVPPVAHFSSAINANDDRNLKSHTVWDLADQPLPSLIMKHLKK
jgi:hypothetical protein